MRASRPIREKATKGWRTEEGESKRERERGTYVRGRGAREIYQYQRRREARSERTPAVVAPAAASGSVCFVVRSAAAAAATASARRVRRDFYSITATAERSTSLGGGGGGRRANNVSRYNKHTSPCGEVKIVHVAEGGGARKER